jgi:hypothetical protein
LREYVPFDVSLPDAQDKVLLSQTGTVEVRRGSIREVRQNGELSAVWTLAANSEGSVSCGRAELVNEVEYIPIERIGACVGGGEGATIEFRVQILVLSWSKDFQGFRVENRQSVGVGLGDDIFYAVDLVRCMGGWHGEPRHVGRQCHGHVVSEGTEGGNADHTFEEDGEFLEVGLTRVVATERDGQPGAILHDGLLGLETGLPAHVPYLAIRLDVELVVEAQAVKPVNGFPFVPLLRGDAERARPGTIEYAGEPRWDLAVNVELYGVWLFSCVVETVGDGGRGASLWTRHGGVQGQGVGCGCHDAQQVGFEI